MEKHRQAVEHWKAAHRDYYLAQKRRLAARPEYKARRREKYRERVEELTLLGLLPRARGRPRLYAAEEALEMRRLRGREAAARHRAKLISQRQEKDEYESGSPSSEGSAGSSSTGGSSADGAPIWHRVGPQNPYWALSKAFR